MTAFHPRIRVSGPVKTRSWHPSTGRVERIEERLLVRDLIRFALFIPHDHFDIAEGVSHALDGYLRAVDAYPSAKALYTCCDGAPDALNERGWELIRDTLKPRGRKYFEDYSAHESFYPEKEGADPYFSIFAKDESGFYFGYHARLPSRQPPPGSVSVLRFTLPMELLEERGSEFIRDLALDMASRIPFATGHAGLALATWPAVDEQVDRLRPLISQYPGFDIRDASIHDHLGTQVDGVHWINFLGPPVLDELGGAATLRTRLHASPTTVRELDGQRAAIILGPGPEAGDLLQGHALPAYQEFARVVAPYLEPFPWRLTIFADPAAERELWRWWRRFLD